MLEKLPKVKVLANSQREGRHYHTSIAIQSTSLAKVLYGRG